MADYYRDTSKDEKEALIIAITRAIAYTENGGKPDIEKPQKGKTGEARSIFQFTPATWKHYASEALGDPNAPITADNETKVAMHKVGQWIDKGYTANQIASMWNAGGGEPDAYTGKFSNGAPSKGVNKKYGVPYDVPGYAEKVSRYAKEFYPQVSGSGGSVAASQRPLNASQTGQTGSGGLIRDLLSKLSQKPSASYVRDADVATAQR